MKIVHLVKDRSIHNLRGAFVTFEIIGEDIMEHILLSVAPPGTVFEMSYEIVEAGTQKGNLHGSGNAGETNQEVNLKALDMDTHTSTSNEKDRPIHDVPNYSKEFIMSTKESGSFTTANSDRPKGGELAKWAGILCNDKIFWDWANLKTTLFVCSASSARSFIIGRCCITSRAHLDHDKDAGMIFRGMMRDFDEWKKA